MIKLTIEALYTLQLMNDKSNDLPFLPLPVSDENESRKSQLKKILEKGYKDLEEIGLLEEGRPTDDFVKFGYYVELYNQNSYHFQIDSNYFCAPGVDKEKKMAIVIKQVGDNEYLIDYFNTIALLSILLENHEILHHLADKKKNYMKSEWEPYSFMRLQAYYQDSKMIRLKTEELGKVINDVLFFNSKSGLFEYDLKSEKIRSVSVDQLKTTLIHGMKVSI